MIFSAVLPSFIYSRRGPIRVAEDAALLRTRLDETSKELESARDAIAADGTSRSREEGEDIAELESEVGRRYYTCVGNYRGILFHRGGASLNTRRLHETRTHTCK